jgi:hypothetical protein
MSFGGPWRSTTKVNALRCYVITKLIWSMKWRWTLSAYMTAWNLRFFWHTFVLHHTFVINLVLLSPSYIQSTNLSWAIYMLSLWMKYSQAYGWICGTWLHETSFFFGILLYCTIHLSLTWFFFFPLRTYNLLMYHGIYIRCSYEILPSVWVNLRPEVAHLCARWKKSSHMWSIMSHMSYGAAVYGWDRGSRIFSTYARKVLLS